MTDQEIIAKYEKKIDEDIQNICKNQGIINPEEIKKFTEKYRSNFIQGFNEGTEENKIAIAEKMINKQRTIKDVMELTDLIKEKIEKLKESC